MILILICTYQRHLHSLNCVSKATKKMASLFTDLSKCFTVLINLIAVFLFNYIQHHTSLKASENRRRTENKNLFDPELPINNIFPSSLAIEGTAKHRERSLCLYNNNSWFGL